MRELFEAKLWRPWNLQFIRARSNALFIVSVLLLPQFTINDGVFSSVRNSCNIYYSYNLTNSDLNFGGANINYFCNVSASITNSVSPLLLFNVNDCTGVSEKNAASRFQRQATLDITYDRPTMTILLQTLFVLSHVSSYGESLSAKTTRIVPSVCTDGEVTLSLIG